MKKNLYNSINLELVHEKIETPDPKDHYLHAHDYYEVIYLLDGGGIVHIEEGTYELEPGDIVLLRPNEVHYMEVCQNKPYERLLLSFGKNLIYAMDPERQLVTPFSKREPGRQNLYRPSDFPNIPLKKHFQDMCSHTDRINMLTQLIQLLKDLNAAFEQMPHYEKERHTDTLEQRLIRLINDNYHLDLSVQSLSNQFFISRAQLYRRFKKATGTTITRYVTLKRLTAAQKLLLEGRKATDVCSICGFQDYSTFYRAYTQHFGYSPTCKKKLTPGSISP